MTMKTFSIQKANWRPLAVCSVLLIAAGCATVPEAPEPAATISVQDDVGFSITESVPVADPVRFQYDDALRLLQQGRIDEGIAALADAECREEEQRGTMNQAVGQAQCNGDIHALRDTDFLPGRQMRQHTPAGHEDCRDQQQPAAPDGDREIIRREAGDDEICEENR